MKLNHSHSAVWTFFRADQVEAALIALGKADFPMNQVFVLTRSSNGAGPVVFRGDTIAHENTQKGATVGAIAGGATGGVAGLILGLGAAALSPVVGPVMIIGAAATALATTLTTGVTGATIGGLLGALIGHSLPKQRVQDYHRYLERGDYLLVVKGTDVDLRHAEAALRLPPAGAFDNVSRSGELSVH